MSMPYQLEVIWCRTFQAVLKIGNLFVTLFVKLHIIKKEQKWRDKVAGVVKKYRGCFECFKHQRGLFWQVLACNVAQRASLIFVSAFVCMSAADCSMLEMFSMQTFAMIGYNSIPLPGGSGAFEFLYLNIYELAGFTSAFVLIAMMVTRVISYYLSILVSGIYTVLYHVLARPATTPAPTGETSSQEKEGIQDEKA